VELSDTAGLHASQVTIESAGIGLARQRLAEADLVVLVWDASSPIGEDAQLLAGEYPAALGVFNKCDLVSSDEHAQLAARGVCTSATRGTGIEPLSRAIAERLVPRSPAPGQAVPFLGEQVAALAKLRSLLTRGDAGAARELLADATSWVSTAS
jgi:tRNA modification GTPase